MSPLLGLYPQVGDGLLEKPDAAAAGLVMRRVTRSRASETQGVGHGVDIVAGGSGERERLVGQADVAAGARACQFETALPHMLRELHLRSADRVDESRFRTGAMTAGDRR